MNINDPVRFNLDGRVSVSGTIPPVILLSNWYKFSVRSRLRGYSVIPTPQKVTLGNDDIHFDNSWALHHDRIAPSHIAVRSLTTDLHEFHRVQLRHSSSKMLRLSIRPGAVVVHGEAELQAQGYRLSISANAVEIVGNGDPGLLYGIQTFLQLLKRGPDGLLRLPAVVIDDWPQLQLRFLHWDTKNHQDRMETLKRYLDWSARFKVNMIGFELEDKFAYPSIPEIGAPGAFTPAELQEIVDYGLERFIQVVPVIQAPAHMAYVLKHPKFAHLRADGNNYRGMHVRRRYLQADLPDVRRCHCGHEGREILFRVH